MDFVNHNSQQAAAPTPMPQMAQAQGKPSKKRGWDRGEALRVLNVVLLALVATIVGLLAVYTAIGGAKGEDKYIDKTKFQAVFLNGGQVYFGRVHTLNDKFITIDNIYYLKVNQQVQPNQTATTSSAQDVTLAKLGCELHGPTDNMVINRDQVLFWENLKSDSQVVKAIDAFVKENPQGQKCETTASTDTSATTSTTATKK